MRSSALISIALAGLAACGGGRAPIEPVTPPQGAKSLVVWPVSNGTVTAYRFDAATRGAAIGTAQTDSSGAFELKLNAPATGPLLVVVSAGAYTEPATGTPVLVDGYELTAVVSSKVRAAGDAIGGLVVSPVSHLVAQLVPRYVSAGATVDVAISQAQPLLNAHFGGIDWTSVSPPDLADPSARSIVQLNDSTKAALVLAGISAEAKNLAQAKGLTPGGPLNSLSLLSAIAGDLGGDGYFDGQAGSARLSVPPGTAGAYALDGQTVRATLAQGISTFLSSSRNASHIALTDAQATMTAIATDANPQLFRDQGGSVDIVPPTIQFVQPAADASVQGQVVVEATATDDTAMGTFIFTAPASLAAAQPSSENSGKTRRLKTALDVSALPDGPLTISVAATDASLNTATQSLTIRVANHGPVVSITGPYSGQTVRGSVTIGATATGQNGATVTKLVLLNPPPGAGTDSLPAADSLSIAWDTTKALEGSYVLQFEADDSFGAASNVSVPVVVDNVPFGIVTAHVSAGGNPIAGATVSVYAIDNSTGEPSSPAGSNGLLGQCSSTDATGTIACTLSVENYQGPVQVTAGGPGLSYTDPSDGATVISIPQTFAFSSYIGNYKTGDQITVPLSLWTTLADAEALTIVQGKHRAQPGAELLSDALATVDGLFENHLSTTVSWDLRSAIPVSLTTSAQSLRDVVYAGLPDLALNQIARDRSTAASVTPGGVITAVTLTQLLQQDLGADGQLDGLGAGGQQLQTAGNPAQKLDANWLRYFMSKALDEWFQTAQNKSGLLSSDIQNAGVFDTIANDTSILFSSSLDPIPYDNQPPVVSFSATYHAADGNDYSPYGTSRAVSGRLDLTVTASDTSGLAALSVQQLTSPAVTLTPGAGSSMPAKFVGSVNTASVADGSLTIGTAESDRLGNAGTSQMAFLADNTPPTVQVTQPTAGTYYTSLIPADVTASDSNGVLSLAETALSVTDNDQTIPHFFGTYAIPSGTPEGPLTPTFKACDNVHNCATVPVAVNYDHTPPQLSLVATPARYTNQGTLSLSVNASDGPLGAGVAAVYAQNGNAPAVSAAPSGGVASLSIALNQGDNSIVLWAVDKAVSWNSGTPGPGNSGKGLAAPYQLTVQVLFDNTAPAPALSNVASYYDETNMQASVNSDGSPVMPATYTYGGASLRAVDTTGATPVNKAATRMSYNGATPTPAALIGANPRNLPFLAYVIPYVAGSDAPIASCTYSATVSCASCGSPPAATGSLILDTTYTSGVRYLLPIAFDTIPALAQAAGQTQVTISIDAQDAAGNAATELKTSFKFQTVAPPAIFAEDASYASENDASGIYTMKINNGTYGKILGYSGFGPEGPRFIRYIAYNSEPTPYAVTANLGGVPGDIYHANATGESWEAWSDYAPPVISGYPVCFDYPSGACGYDGNPCGSGVDVYAPDGTLAGCTTSTWFPTDRINPEAGVSAGPLAVGPYQVSGSSEITPTSSSNGGVVIPAAVGATPGRLIFYVARPLATTDRDQRGGVPSPIDWNTSFNRYQELYATYLAGNGGGGDCDCDPDTGRCSGYYSCYGGFSPWYEYLSSADSKLFGTISLSTTSLVPGTGTALGTSRSTSAVNFSRDIPN